MVTSCLLKQFDLFADEFKACQDFMMLCEVASWCKKNGITLWDQMLAIYEKYGYYKEDLYTITLKGIDGSKQIGAIMDKLRSNPSLSGLRSSVHDSLL